MRQGLGLALLGLVAAGLGLLGGARRPTEGLDSGELWPSLVTFGVEMLWIGGLVTLVIGLVKAGLALTRRSS